MPGSRAIVLATCLLLAIGARAEDAITLSPVIGDMVYKGIVGKALDAVPMDPDQRVTLQRTNAVVSNTLAGRSLSVWAGLGLTNPILLIAGLAWGLYAALHIKAEGTNPRPDSHRAEPPVPVEIVQDHVALLKESPAEEERPK